MLKISQITAEYVKLPTGSKSKVISFFDISWLAVLAKLGVSLQEAHVECETESRVCLRCWHFSDELFTVSTVLF